MNAPSAIPSLAISKADLEDRTTCERIDSFVAEHRDSTLFHRPQWSRMVEAGCGQKVAGLIAEQRGVLVGWLPLTKVRSRLFGSALVSAGFGTGGGILAENERTAGQLAEAAWNSAVEAGLGSAELRGGPVPEGWTATSGTYSGFTRELPSDEEALLRSIPRKQRAEVRRSMTLGLEIRRGRDESLRRAFYSVFAESVRNLGTPVLPKALFDSALDLFGDSAEILLVSKDGRPVATQILFHFRETCLSYWGGGTSEARALRGNDLVWFEAMREAIQRGFTIADFGRSKVGTGPWARKRNWGFAEREIAYSVRTASGQAPREINPLSPRYRLQVAAWQKLPLGLANRLGPHLSRGLG